MPKYKNEFEEISSFTSKKEYRKSKKTKNNSHINLKISISVVSVLLILVGVGFIFVSTYLFGGLTTKEITKDKRELGIASGVITDKSITNIALFGLDSRSDDFVGLSDVVMVLSLDGAHNKIKLTSILRDSYVNVGTVDDVWMDKLAHAYSYGGAEQAMRAINQNFNLDIEDYVTVNFSKMSSIVDAFGGVDIDVTNAEVIQINKNLGEIIRKGLGAIESDRMDEGQSGMLHLNGAQAVAYARIRKIDNDNVRAERQQKVLSILMGKATKLSPLEYPAVISQLSALCQTSLSATEILGFAPFAGSGFTVETLVIPGEAENPKDGKDAEGYWIWDYDIQAGANHIQRFIFEEKAIASANITNSDATVYE